MNNLDTMVAINQQSTQDNYEMAQLQYDDAVARYGENHEITRRYAVQLAKMKQRASNGRLAMWISLIGGGLTLLVSIGVLIWVMSL